MKIDYIKVFFACLFSIVIVYPAVRDWFNQREIDNDLKGENKKWDSNELWDRSALRFASGFFYAIILMVLMVTLFPDVKYPLELYLLLFAGTLGSNGVKTALLIMKNQKDKKEE